MEEIIDKIDNIEEQINSCFDTLLEKGYEKNLERLAIVAIVACSIGFMSIYFV